MTGHDYESNPILHDRSILLHRQDDYAVNREDSCMKHGICAPLKSGNQSDSRQNQCRRLERVENFTAEEFGSAGEVARSRAFSKSALTDG